MRAGSLRGQELDGLVSALFGMLLRHSPNNVCYLRIARSASIPNNIHITLVMLALAFLTSLVIGVRSLPSAPVGLPTSSDADLVTGLLCPLSVPEVHRLLARL